MKMFWNMTTFWTSLNFQRCLFESVEQLAENLKPKLKVCEKGTSVLKGKILVTIRFFLAVLKDATAKFDKDGNKTCRTDVLGYYLQTVAIPRAIIRMFENLFKWAKFLQDTIHGKAV